jgi:hypothetical protein
MRLCSEKTRLLGLNLSSRVPAAALPALPFRKISRLRFGALRSFAPRRAHARRHWTQSNPAKSL